MKTALAGPKHARIRPRWRMPMLALATSLIFVLGTAILLAPTASNWFTQLQQAAEIEEVARATENLPPTALDDAITAAKVYNTTLIGGAMVAANERIPLPAAGAEPADERAYDNLLRASDDGLMGRIKIDKIALDQPVYHGTADHTLEHGIGHLEGTSLPVGGIGTRTVLTGHRGLATSELFSRLDEIERGDTFTIEVFGEVLTYQVTTVEVVEPSDSRALYPDATRDLATLVTCTPLGINSHRILVTGERVTPTPIAELERAGDVPQIPGFPWWLVIFGAVVLAAIIYVGFAGRPRPASGKTSSSDLHTPLGASPDPDERAAEV